MLRKTIHKSKKSSQKNKVVNAKDKSSKIEAHSETNGILVIPKVCRDTQLSCDFKNKPVSKEGVETKVTLAENPQFVSLVLNVKKAIAYNRAYGRPLVAFLVNLGSLIQSKNEN